MRFRRRLRSRIILAFLLFGVGLTATFAGITLVMREWLEETLIVTTLQKEIDSVVEQTRIDPASAGAVPFSRIEGRTFSSAKFANVPFAWRGFDSGVHEIAEADADGNVRTYKLAVRKAEDYWAFLKYDITEERRVRNRLVVGLTAVVGGFALFSVAVAFWLSTRVLRPVTDLAARVRRFERGKRPPPLAPHFADDEVGELATALDGYSERLNDLVVRDREFNADVSHELRTPLAVIRGATELLLAQEGLPDKARERVRRIDRAARQSTELTQALLLLSRSERAAPTDGETSDVAQVVEQVIETHRPQIGSKPVEVQIHRDAPATVAAPSSVLAVALGNLIGNAFKYTPSGRVDVRIEAHRVVVADTGTGFADGEAPKLFERGVRGEKTSGTGAGLGLAIVRRLCELYGWQVSLVPREGGGAVATLEFEPPLQYSA